MKALIAAACVAVIAFAGYYFWGEYSTYSAREAHASAVAAERENARREIYRLAAADPGEDDMASAWCKLTVMRAAGGSLDGNKEASRIIANCKMLGFIQ